MSQLIGYLSEGEQLKGSLTIPKQIGGGGGGTLETITKTYTPTTSQQTDTITPGVGYDGIAEVDVTVNAMPTGTEGTPTATKGAVSNHSVNVTPSVTNVAGYIAGGTKTGTAVTVSASELVSGTKSITANSTGIDVANFATADVAVPNSYSASDEGKVVSNGALVSQTAHADVTPTTSDQTIDTTLNNSLKVKGDADLVAGNIKKDVEIFGVTGSYEGGGLSGYEVGTFTPASDVSSVSFPVSFNPAYLFVYVADGNDIATSSAYHLIAGYVIPNYSNRAIRQSGVNTSGEFNKSYNSGTGMLTVSRPSGSWTFQSGVTYHWIAREVISS